MRPFADGKLIDSGRLICSALSPRSRGGRMTSMTTAPGPDAAAARRSVAAGWSMARESVAAGWSIARESVAAGWSIARESVAAGRPVAVGRLMAPISVPEPSSVAPATSARDGARTTTIVGSETKDAATAMSPPGVGASDDHAV